jgi:hypothetical protein
MFAVSILLSTVETQNLREVLWDYQENDDVSIAPEGAQLILPDDDNNIRTPMVGLPLGRPIGQGHDGASSSS